MDRSRRYTPDGDVVQSFQIGTDQDDLVTNLVMAGEDGFYLVGATSGTFEGQANAGGQDAFVGKYDAAGEGVWIQQFGTAGIDIAYDLTIDQEANVYVVGSELGGLGSPDNDPGAFLNKYDPAGGSIWSQHLTDVPCNDTWAYENPTILGRSARAVGPDATGQVRVLGFSQVRESVWEDTERTFSAGVDVGYDTSGTLTHCDAMLYLKVAPSLDQAAVDAVLCPGGVGYLLTWYHESGDSEASGGQQLSVRRLDPDRSTWWDPISVGPALGVGGLGVDGEGHVFVAGSTAGSLPGFTSEGGTDAFVRVVQ